MRDQNYATLSDYQPWPVHEPGWFMLEWDIAMDRADRERFAANAMTQPERIRVGPYMLFPDGDVYTEPRQVHRWNGLPIPEGKPHADMVGFGCIYFPQKLLTEFWGNPPPRTRQGVLNDGVFSDWYRLRHCKFDVDWSVHPQHLHGD
jgi:hypothetical protein